MAEADKYRWTKSLRNLPEVTCDNVVRIVNEHSQVETSKLRKGYKFFWEKFIFNYRVCLNCADSPSLANLNVKVKCFYIAQACVRQV